MDFDSRDFDDVRDPCDTRDRDGRDPDHDALSLGRGPNSSQIDMLILPGEPGHAELQQLLTLLPHVGRGLPRAITDTTELSVGWPGSCSRLLNGVVNRRAQAAWRSLSSP